MDENLPLMTDPVEDLTDTDGTKRSTGTGELYPYFTLKSKILSRISYNAFDRMPLWSYPPCKDNKQCVLTQRTSPDHRRYCQD